MQARSVKPNTAAAVNGCLFLSLNHLRRRGRKAQQTTTYRTVDIIYCKDGLKYLASLLNRAVCSLDSRPLSAVPFKIMAAVLLVVVPPTAILRILAKATSFSTILLAGMCLGWSHIGLAPRMVRKWYWWATYSTRDGCNSWENCHNNWFGRDFIQVAVYWFEQKHQLFFRDFTCKGAFFRSARTKALLLLFGHCLQGWAIWFGRHPNRRFAKNTQPQLTDHKFDVVAVGKWSNHWFNPLQRTILSFFPSRCCSS